MSVYITDKDGKLVKVSGSNANFTLPIGSIFSSAIPIMDANVHLLDGSLISQTGLYKTFADLIKSLVASSYNISCSETEFNNDVSATGNCGKFVVDNTAGTIRLPKITTFIQGLSSITDIGKSLEAGLPNITGTINNNWTSSASYSGALYLVGTGSANRAATGSSNAYNMGIDASMSNSIYGNSDTVQPQATQFPYYIVLAAGYKPSQVVEMDNIVSDVNLKQNKLIANPVALNTTRAGQNDTVIEYYMSSDGSSWYRKWASGWKECGIRVTKTVGEEVAQKITLPVTYSNTKYTCSLQAAYSAGGSDNCTVTININDIGTNYIYAVPHWSTAAGTIEVYCCGF